jgi:glycosyltransferase involved in cell wall biosynthesis
MSIAYLINQYPLISHSFIRREIEALEAQGLSVLRISIRRQESELTEEENVELAKTHFVLEQPVITFIRSVFGSLLKGPLPFFQALLLGLKAGWRSDRGIFVHLIYFAEATLLAQWCRERGISHIHVHFGTNSATVAMLTSQLSGLPYSMTVHGPEEFDKPIAICLGEKIARSKFTVAVSSYGSSQLRRWVSHTHWPKIHIVHCGLDKSFYAGSINPIGGARFLCIGRLTEQKGHLLLLSAAKHLQDLKEDFEIVLLGDGPLRFVLEKQIAEYGLNKIVRITGWMPGSTIRKEIELSRALVLPSFAEGLPVAIMEAMALERPVISTHVAGIPELVVDGKTGWLVPAGDAMSLAGAMQDVLHMPDRQLQRMGKLGRERVLARHDIEQEASKLASLLSGNSTVSASITPE